MSIDKFFDTMDELADGVGKVLSTTHHPDKNYEDVEDAEVVHEEVSAILGLVEDGWHVFRGVSNRTLCKKTIEPNLIEARKRLGGNGHSRVCNACLAIAFQTQSSEP